MRLICWIIILFLLQTSFAGVRIAKVNTDSIIEENIEDLLQRYLEYFNLSDIKGDYHFSYENNFRSLFEEDAKMHNFLPGTRHYQQSVVLDDYISGVKSTLDNYIVRPGELDYRVERIAKTGLFDLLTAEVLLNKRVLLYSKATYEVFYDLDLPLTVTILVDFDNDIYRISGIQAESTRVVDLSFRVLDNNNNLLRYKGFDFVYYDPHLGTQITRTRYSDSKGVVRINKVPEEAEIQLKSKDKIYQSLLSLKDAGAWSEATVSERFYVFAPVEEAVTPPTHVIRFGITYPLPIVTLQIGCSMHRLTDNPMVDLQKELGFYLDYSKVLFFRGNHGVSLGGGIDYMPLRIHAHTRDLVYLDAELTDKSGLPDEHHIARITQEKYLMDAWSIPVIISYTYYTNNKYFKGVSIWADGRYVYEPDVKFSYKVDKNPYMNYAYNEPLVFAKTMEGSFRQEQKVMYTIGSLFSFNLYNDFLFLQYRLAYGFQRLGNQRSVIYTPKREESDNLLYDPVFKNHQLKFRNLQIGVGLSLFL